MIIRKLRLAYYYLVYRIRSSSKFGVHSPYIYNFYTEVILDRTFRDAYNRIEQQRASLLRQRSLLETTDFGAGASSGDYKTRFRQVKEVTKHSSISPKFGKLIHRIVSHIAPKEIMEVGTAMGISTLYIATAAPKSKIVTMEGCAMIAEKARENFNIFKMENIELDLGNFNTLMAKTLQKFDQLDFVLIDGNHRKDPTIEYFEMMLPLLQSNSIVMIDDIYWSKGMTEAWNKIKKNERVSISIDLFKMGVLIFKEDIAKEDFILKF